MEKNNLIWSYRKYEGIIILHKMYNQYVSIKTLRKYIYIYSYIDWLQ